MEGTEDLNTLKTSIQALKDAVTAKAEGFLHGIMPKKVALLEQTYLSEQFNRPLSEVSATVDIKREAICVDTRDIGVADDAEGASKKRKLSSTTSSSASVTGTPASLSVSSYQITTAQDIPCNKAILDVLAFIKQEVVELIEITNTVKIWIQLNIPRIEDGNNFGVSIQEETVNELQRAEDPAFTALDGISKYYTTRAKIISKCLKYPTIEDYVQSVKELDEKQYISLKLCVLDLRNNYATLHDMITKNLAKLKQPRSSHSERVGHYQ